MPSLKKYRIVIGKNATFNEKRAASMLAAAIRLTLGTVPQTVTDESEPAPLEIVLGRTTRAELDGLEFAAYPDRTFDFVTKYVNGRLYIVGLGADRYFSAPYKTYAVMNDGAIGTVIGVYRFCADVLGYDHALAMYDPIPILDDAVVDESCNVDYTREAYFSAMPPLVDGTVMYSIPSPLLDTAQGCTVFKTKSGKLVVIDGGVHGAVEHVLACLEHLSCGERPRVSAWLHSHLHADHFGVLNMILSEDKYRDRVDIDDMYVGFPPLDYFIKWSPEAHPSYEDHYNRIMSIDKLKGTKIHKVSEGEHIVIDELDFKVVRVPDITGPAPEGKKLMNINDTSVIYKLFVGGQSILFLGDAEQNCNAELLEKHRDDLPCDILQVPHHGNGNVSLECYNIMKAKLYLFQGCYRSWFSDGGEGLFSRNIGVIRTHYFIKSQGVPNDRILLDGLGIVTLKLPVEL